MTIDEFTDNLDRWGSNLGLWPESLRRAGTQLLRESAEARQAHGRAQQIDSLLATEHRAPPALQGQILAQIAGEDYWQRLADWFAQTFWRPSLAAACMLALGFAFGLAGDIEDLTDSDLEAVSMLAFFDNYQEIDNAL